MSTESGDALAKAKEAWLVDKQELQRELSNKVILRTFAPAASVQIALEVHVRRR